MIDGDVTRPRTIAGAVWLSILLAGTVPGEAVAAGTSPSPGGADRRPVPPPDARRSGDDAQRAARALPIPRRKPGPSAPVGQDQDTTGKPPPGPAMLPRREMPARSPADEAACRERLAGLGVVYVEAPDIADAGGCHAERVIRVTAIGPKLALSGPATMVCPMAEALARWGETVLRPAAERIGRKAVTLAVGASYECRPRNRVAGSKLSEHGAANAIDIMGVAFADGAMTVTKAGARLVRPPPATADPAASPAASAASSAGRPEAPAEWDARFLAEIRAGACKHFTTVLGPGQPWHDDHLHLDLGLHGRSGTSRICQ
ncbi:extensin-like domain-containing protein [Prosthecodimorpha staleyi]|uniref:Extensin family protein n=1 Tax=Prosthecodimorpha staleyi TaxID=2840188 RepID=A0A947D7T2_9HYPH|nr:extensin family protein [Prosthecodimorpha staleyi]MBT9292680.1 extensin family protein [Prosthecodimorpha staleyi]